MFTVGEPNSLTISYIFFEGMAKLPVSVTSDSFVILMPTSRSVATRVTVVSAASTRTCDKIGREVLFSVMGTVFERLSKRESLAI